jgi:hypothetical protein
MRMSDTSQDEGWWQASDNKWYPPEQHPSNQQGAAPSGGMAEELRPDIKRAKNLMSFRLGSNREVKRLADYLWDNERVDRMVNARYGGGVGLLVLTNRRLLFLKDGVMKQTHEDFPLDKVSSVQWSSGLTLGKLTIFASGNKAEVDQVQKKDGKDFVDHVRERIASGSETRQAASEPAATATSPASVADELKKLAELRDSGVLTDDEFAAQKARLLGD